MGSPLTYPLSELDASSVSVAGGKGSSLGELIRAGAPVPPGFVITSSAFEAFLNAGDHRQYVEDVVEQFDTGQIKVAQAARQIAVHLGDVPVPDEVVAAVDRAVSQLGAARVSVRSSATCEDSGTSAWAGQLDTYLDVPPENIVEKVRDCWLSMFSTAALAYGAAHGYGGGQFAVAVVVEKMVASDVSGIGFSVHPVTQEPNILLIEACFGLGEAIVSGKIVPDQYVIERGTDKILECSVGGQKQGLFFEPGDSSATWRELGDRGNAQKLTDEQVVEYAELLSRIHQHYGHPVDTEWALEDGRFRVLQARPITTLAEEYRETVIDQPDAWQFLVRRPMSLVEVSIWSHWIDSKHALKSLGMHADQALAIQDDAGMSHDFLTKQAMEAGLRHIGDLMRNDRPHLVEILKRGQAIYRDAQELIDRGAAAFRDLDEAADFFSDAAQHTTVFPAWVLVVYEREGIEDPEIRALAEGLRLHTLYPSIQRRIIDPLVTDAAKAIGFSSPQQAPAVTT